MDTATFFKNLNQRSLTPRWPLNPCLLRSHVWLYPSVIVSKSHGNTSMYVDTVIKFAKLPHTTYHIHTCTHTVYILRTEWVITKSLTEHSSGETKMTSKLNQNDTRLDKILLVWLVIYWTEKNDTKMNQNNTSIRKTLFINNLLRGYCTPEPYFWRLCAFSQKLK